jgi:hypothetical protein
MTSFSTRHYCVDGTNVVRVCHGYGGPAFRAQEEADALRLVETLALLCESLDGRVEIEVFFDGGFKPWARQARGLRVRFTHETQADELILDRVRASAALGQGKVTVVTADGELGRLVQEEGGRWQRVTPGAGLGPVTGAIQGRFKK